MFFDTENLRKKSKQPIALKGERYKSPVYPLVPVNWFTQETLTEEAGGRLSFDMETYPNWYCLCFKSFATGRVLAIQVNEGDVPPLDLIQWVLHNFEIVGFNNHDFDDPLVWAILSGKYTLATKLITIVTAIIHERLKSWMTAKQFGYKIHGSNSVDIMNVCPLQANLKLYGGRLHAKRMQDLPIKPGTELTAQQKHDTLYYCINDLDQNILIHNHLEKQLKLRVEMGIKYNTDLRSKSDAQIAETVIASEVGDLLGRKVYAPNIEPGTVYKYHIPQYLSFELPQLQTALELIRDAYFAVGYSGHIQLPDELSGYVIEINGKKYKLGIGGLHSQEKKIKYVADEENLIVDRDVASYYPAIILSQDLYPAQMGTAFLEVYRNIVETRLNAKISGNKSVADSLKIVINSSFGKFGNLYSSMYSPQMVIQVTLTGQLLLLKLIDMFETKGFEVISANTDGVVTRVPKSRKDEFNAICDEWVELTDLGINDSIPVLEETKYVGYYGRDVNNYIAVKEGGKTKGKGAYTTPYDEGSWNFALQKNPQTSICVEAVKSLLVDGTPVDETIKACKDIRKFVSVRQVAGGGSKDGVLIGKNIRWYYKKGELGHIETPKGGMVSKTKGAWPLLELPDELPLDIDYHWYIQEAKYILMDIGWYNRDYKPEPLGFKVRTATSEHFDLDDEIPF